VVRDTPAWIARNPPPRLWSFLLESDVLTAARSLPGEITVSEKQRDNHLILLKPEETRPQQARRPPQTLKRLMPTQVENKHKSLNPNVHDSADDWPGGR
jgi:hypothetical protein